MKKKALVWIRRDLRLQDHAPLTHAASLAKEVALVFVFDPQLLRGVPKSDRRISFIQESLREIDTELRKKGSALIVRRGDPRLEIPRIAKEIGAELVCTGRDYEPYAKERDEKVAENLAKIGVEFQAVKDHVLFEGKEITTQTGGSFKVFTPYYRAWESALGPEQWEVRQARPKFLRLPPKELDLPPPVPLWLEPGEKAAQIRLKKFAQKIEDYKTQRDFPSVEGTSGLSVHLRFGTISTRACVRLALKAKDKTWLKELVWREFYQMILDQNPHVVGHAFRPEYDNIRWPGKPAHFEAWCQGRTGFPIVDAAMRHFNDTGWMHNRLRMIVASFLVKDLLIDWRQGEAYFAKNLLDFDLASNNGGWQWCASTGCDAQPYFRIFNPESQAKKFDPQSTFIREHLPEVGEAKYPKPIVDHGVQRIKAIQLFKDAKAKRN